MSNTNVNLDRVYELIDKVGDEVYAVLTLGDFGYDEDNKKTVYPAKLIQAVVAIRNKQRDYFVIVNIRGICITIWSDEIPNKLFFREEDALNYIDK